MTTVEIERNRLESHRAAPGQFLERWVYRILIDGEERVGWDRGLADVRRRAARLGGVKASEVIETWKSK